MKLKLLIIIIIIIFLKIILFLSNQKKLHKYLIKYKYNKSDIKSEPIDVVYTWVDSTDKNWNKLKNKLASEEVALVRFPNNIKPDLELETSLELSLKNINWTRYIYIVTVRPQIPKCLKENKNLKKNYKSGRIKIIHHDEIGIPITFNSSVIECYLHNIPTLSENFLYLNDDFYILKKCPYSYFFKDKRPISIYEYRYENYMPYFLLFSTHSKSIKYTLSLLEHDISYMKNHAVPYSLNKSICKYVFNKYRKYILENHKNIFRSPNDLKFYTIVINQGIQKGNYATYDNIPFKAKFFNKKRLKKYKKEILDLTFLCYNPDVLDYDKLFEDIKVLRDLL